MNMNYSNNYDNYNSNADIISVNADANVNVNDHSRNNALPFNALENSYSTGFI